MLTTTVRTDFMASSTPDMTPVSGSGEGGQPPYDLPSMLPSNNPNSTEWFYNMTLLRTSNSTPDGDLDSGGISSASQITVIVVYTVAIVLSFVGNMLVIIVFSCGKRSRTDLRGFLISLAVSDLIQGLFCMPFSFTSIMLQRWIFTAPMCPIVLFMQLTSVTASVCTNMAIGMDRFWVVMFPLRSRLTKSRYKIVISVIWLISLALSSVQLYVGRAVPQAPHSAALDCSENWPNETWTRGYTIFILVITYIIPLSILTFTYSFVGKKLWQRTAPGNADEARDTQQLRSKRKVIKMLVVVVVLFGICWLPLHLFMILLDFVLDPSYAQQQSEILQPLYFAFHWLAMSNSFVNPIIYGFMNDSFRDDIVDLFPSGCGKCLNDLRQLWFRGTGRRMGLSTSESMFSRNYMENQNNERRSSSGRASPRFLSSRYSSSKRYLAVRMNGEAQNSNHNSSNSPSWQNAAEPHSKLLRQSRTRQQFV